MMLSVGGLFLFRKENFISAFQKILEDIDPIEIEMELKRLVLIVMENKESLKTADYFLYCICNCKMQMSIPLIKQPV